MTAIDWTIVGLFVSTSLLIGLWFTKRASASTDDFFIAGRSLPWYIAGTSMVATTFSSDTPLFVAGAVRESGIYANWFWWSAGIGTIVCVFFFARLWRRSEAVTDIQFITLRYDANPAVNLLRIFRAIFDGIFVNCIVMASVTLAMSKILVVILDLSTQPVVILPIIGGLSPGMLILLLLGAAAVLYTALSGLYGVVYTDLIQFCLAMVGAFALAIIVYLDLDQQGGVLNAIQASSAYTENTLQIFPPFGWNLDTATFLIMITVGWWAVAPGSGYFIQRTLATRSERDAMLGLYWFATCHYIIRSWPWIVVGIASIVYFPVLLDAEQSYPLMINEFLPVGLKGVMVASLLAAFMSTLDTQMNWGASYLIVDIYQPFLATEKSQHHYVSAARICMVALTMTAILVSTQLSGILTAYQYLAVVLSGTSFVLIARWYWWRITVWSEISSLLSSFIVGNTLLFLIPDTDQEQWFAVRLLINLIVTTCVCLLVTFATSKTGPSQQAINFFTKIRVPGRGWSRVSSLCGVDAEPIGFLDCSLGAIGSIFGLFGLLLCVGELVLGSPANAVLYGVIAAAGISISISKFRAIINTLGATNQAPPG